MKCPKCGGATHVIETRHLTDKAIKRRRECLRCGFRQNTWEMWER